MVEFENFGEGIASGVFLAHLPHQRAEVHQRIHIRRSELKRFVQVAFGALNITRGSLYRCPQPEHLRSFVLRDLNLLKSSRGGIQFLLRAGRIVLTYVESRRDSDEVQSDRAVLPAGAPEDSPEQVCIPSRRPAMRSSADRNAAEDGVETVVVAVDLCGFVEKRAGRIGLSHIHPGLRCAQLQPNIPSRCLCQSRIERCSILRFTREFIGVGQLSPYIGCLDGNRL